MSYVKTTWANGDIITAEKLNKLEDGVADSGGSGGSIQKVGRVAFWNKDEFSIPATTSYNVVTWDMVDADVEDWTPIDELPEYDFAVIDGVGDVPYDSGGSAINGIIVMNYIMNLVGEETPLSTIIYNTNNASKTIGADSFRGALISLYKLG